MELGGDLIGLNMTAVHWLETDCGVVAANPFVGCFVNWSTPVHGDLYFAFDDHKILVPEKYVKIIEKRVADAKKIKKSIFQ